MTKPKHISIHIPEPCSQNWEDMAVSGQGRYCVSCAKTVTDFSMMTDAEIIRTLKKAGDQHICGRFYMDQTDRPLKPQKNKAPFPTRFAARVAASLVVLQSVVATVVAQTTKPATAAVAAHKGQAKKAAAKYLKGSVIDLETGNGLPGMIVTIAGTGVQAATDENGRFKIPLSIHGVDSLVLSTSYGLAACPAPANTMIPDKVVTQAEILAGSEVTLFRYTQQTLEPVTTLNTIRLDTQRFVTLGGIGGDRMLFKKFQPQSRWQRFKSFFRRKHKNNH